jgi:hypothetical protein
MAVFEIVRTGNRARSRRLIRAFKLLRDVRGFGTSRRLLSLRKSGRYRSEADMSEIYEYAP